MKTNLTPRSVFGSLSALYLRLLSSALRPPPSALRLLPPALCLLTSALCPPAFAQGTAFTYQGRLNDGVNPASGIYDLRFTIYDSTNNPGVVIAGPLTNSAVGVSNGYFTVTLDFGAGVFTGPARWLEIGVRTDGSVDPHVLLTPRQLLTATPYAIRALSAATVDQAIPVPYAGPVQFINPTNRFHGQLFGEIFGDFFGDAFGDFFGNFFGNGTALVSLNASSLTMGTVPDARLSTNVALLSANQTFTGSNTFTGVINATNATNRIVGSFFGDGGGLTNLSAVQLSGTIPEGNLSGNIARLNGNQTFTGNVTFNSPSNTFNGGFQGDGSGLTNINLGALNAWQFTGNTGSTPGLHFVGTLDNQALEFRANNRRALRLEPTADDPNHTNAPNVIGGAQVNGVAPGVYGATIAGGGAEIYLGAPYSNSVAQNFGTIGGGGRNRITADAPQATIGGGINITIEGENATIGGGSGNQIGIDAFGSTIAGGMNNGIRLAASGSTVSGGINNRIETNKFSATIGGGHNNVIVSPNSLIGGGTDNLIQSNAAASTIAGGYVNQILTNCNASVISGGALNSVAPVYNSSIQSPIGASYATIGGGAYNLIQGSYSTISGGSDNQMNGFPFLNGAFQPNYGTICGGRQNQVNVNQYSTVAGGYNNVVSGTGSFAAGRNCIVQHNGCFMWSDGTLYFATVVDNAFYALATGGFYLYTGSGAGVQVAGGGNAWSALSDRNVKENLQPVDCRAVLEKVVALPVTTWNLKTQSPDIRHIGAMAQDFKAAFTVGEDDRHISTSDADGVTLAAIQGLNLKVEDRGQKSEVRSQRAEVRIQKLESENAELKRELGDLKQLVSSLAGKLNGAAR